MLNDMMLRMAVEKFVLPGIENANVDEILAKAGEFLNADFIEPETQKPFWGVPPGALADDDKALMLVVVPGYEKCIEVRTVKSKTLVQALTGEQAKGLIKILFVSFLSKTKDGKGK